MRKLAVLVAALIGSGVASAQNSGKAVVEDFVLDSTSSTYPFVMRLEGTSSREGDSIVIDVKAGEVRSNIPAEYGDVGKVTNVAIEFGLGKDTEKGWQMFNFTSPVSISADLRAGETIPVTTHRFVIKGIANLPLADEWLAAGLHVDQKLPEFTAGTLWSYACAQVNLLGPTPKSRDRARRTLANYAHAC